MEAPETPLVLLSHAAAFVNRDVISHVGDYEDKKVANSKTPAVKHHKLKRSNEKGDFSPSTGPAKVKRPLQLQSTTSATDAKDLMEVDTNQRDAYGSPQLSKQLDPSPYDPCHCTENPSEDKPLDMSKKCSVVEQQRPSVITCAPTLLRKTQGNKGEPPVVNIKRNERENSHRREIVSGMCDPVIDEHFRRSLGKDYPQIFSAPSTAASVSITVDDHFAKALGETWQRLQEKTSSASTSSVDSPVKETDKSAKLSSSSSLGLITL